MITFTQYLITTDFERKWSVQSNFAVNSFQRILFVNSLSTGVAVRRIEQVRRSRLSSTWAVGSHRSVEPWVGRSRSPADVRTKQGKTTVCSISAAARLRWQHNMRIINNSVGFVFHRSLRVHHFWQLHVAWIGTASLAWLKFGTVVNSHSTYPLELFWSLHRELPYWYHSTALLPWLCTRQFCQLGTFTHTF